MQRAITRGAASRPTLSASSSRSWMRLPIHSAGRRQLLLLFVALVAGATLAFHGLANHRFWDDEANTAIFARNFNDFGTLTAWDGRNLVGFGGGRELDENLVNSYMPPLQYWVAAWGLRTFSDPTFGGRFPFVVAGITAILLLALWTRRFLGRKFPWALAAILLALSPTFLLYIRNCRYYALGVLFTIATLECACGRLTTSRDKVVRYALGSAATVALWLSHYINAAALFATLPLLFLLPEFRSRARVMLVATLYAVSGAVGTWILWTRNPFASPSPIDDPTPKVERFFTLLWWQAKGLATFEFVPVLLCLPLFAPFVVSRLRGHRLLARRGLLIVAFLGISCIVTAALSPQPVNIRAYAQIGEMRYQVPAIAFGAVLASISLVILAALSRTTAVVVALTLVLSNVLHLGFLREAIPNFPKKGVNSTLYEYVSENFNDYTTGTEALVRFLRSLPRDTVVCIAPSYLAFAPMFYVPKILFACQLANDFRASPELAAELPDYLFLDRAELDMAIVRWDAAAAPESFATPSGHEIWPAGYYRRKGHLNSYPIDRNRPELPWHSFSDDEFASVTRIRHIVYEVRRSPPLRQ